MARKLAGVQFVRNAIDQDYCVLESLKSMGACCDKVFIVDAGSTDHTVEMLENTMIDSPLEIITVDDDLWPSIEGHEKLSFFTNIAIERAQRESYDYIISVQADEVLHEDSFVNIRAAVEQGGEAYVFNRYNLFKDPYHMLNVEQARKPCSTEVVRLTKSKYRAYSDAEHIDVPECHPFNGKLDAIEIFHMGFVRDGKKHLIKIRHMLTEVFKMGMDTRAENCETFQWDRFFSEEDLLPIPKKLPKFVQAWVDQRYPDLKGI